MSAPKLSRADIGNCSQSLSPSKARIAPRSGVQTTKDGRITHGARVTKFCDMPDPEGRYAGLINENTDLADAKVISPDVRDGHGVLITPGEYDKKIKHDDYVEVEVYLKLWNFQPNDRSNKNSQNGSRIYQIIMKNMKILPFDSYIQVGLLKTPNEKPPDKKGKRKADDDDELPCQSPTKKTSASQAVFDMDLTEN